MVNGHTGKAFTVSAPHSGVGVTAFKLKRNGTLMELKGASHLANGHIAFAVGGGLVPGTHEFIIEASGDGGIVAVSETVTLTAPPPAPPAPFSGPIVVTFS